MRRPGGARRPRVPRARAGVATFALVCAATHALAGCGANAQVWTGPSDTVTAYPGSQHCNWDSVLFLDLGDQMFVFDPGANIERRLLTSEPDKDADLPADAVDTGLRRGDATLWLAADGDALYVVSGDHAQKWPRALEPFGCD